MGMAVATMVLGGKTFEREVAGVLFDSIGEALVSTKSIVPGSKKRLIKKPTGTQLKKTRKRQRGEDGGDASTEQPENTGEQGKDGGDASTGGNAVGDKPLRPLQRWLLERQAGQFVRDANKIWQALPMAVKKQYSKDTQERRGVKGTSGSAATLTAAHSSSGA